MTNSSIKADTRFLVKRLQNGPWLVVDRLHNDRLVASCPIEDDAHAIAALMHRDPVEALKYVKFTLDRLDVMLPDASQRGLTNESGPTSAAIPVEDLNASNDE